MFDILALLLPRLFPAHLRVLLSERPEAEAGPEHRGGEDHVVVHGADLLWGGGVLLGVMLGELEVEG